MTRKNSFDFIRLLAAILVIFSHSFALTGNFEPHLGNTTLGTIAVWIFFILSGYLISKSWDQYPRFNVFFAKRLLRIIPGLAVVTVGTIIIVGLFFSALPLIDYFTNNGTYAYLNNIFLYNPDYNLPGGGFASNFFTNTVNGSIWSLSYEFTMYLMVAFIGVLGIYKKVSPFAIWLGLLVLASIITIVGKEHFSVELFYLKFGDFIILALMFFSGIMLTKYPKIIKLDARAGLISLAVFIGASAAFPTIVPLLGSVFLAYALFSIGKYEGMSWVSKYGDYSYGIYIYAFPIQQIIATSHTTNPIKMFCIALFLTSFMAIVSWHLVESKALKWKDKINTKKYPLLQMDEAW